MKKILYFSTLWCQPCRTLGPIIHESTKHGVVYEKIDVDSNQFNENQEDLGEIISKVDAELHGLF